MKRLLILLVALLLVGKGAAQAYKYLDAGLSSKRVYAIQKDGLGYMWLMTHTGIDRFDGTDFRHYRLSGSVTDGRTDQELAYLFLDSRQEVWVVSRQGDIFHYDRFSDRFECISRALHDTQRQSHAPVSCCYMDEADNIWMSSRTDIHIYHTRLHSCTQIPHDFNRSFTCMEQIDAERFFVGTAEGIHYACIENDCLQLTPCIKLDTLQVAINEIYFHRPTQQVFMGTMQQGVVVYDLKLHQAYHLRQVLADVQINRIRSWGQKYILLATEGAGVYRMNVNDYHCEPYITADHEHLNGMNGNDIKDLYIDEEQRIWMAVYPLGVTVRDDRYPAYQWYRHSIGNPQSLVNDQVNAVIEDSEGDLWMATNNGISLYESKRRRWSSYVSSYDDESQSPHHTFFTLCEVTPGVIWAGGYQSGIYRIEKRSRRVQLLMPSQFGELNMLSDKSIRVLKKDRAGIVWVGGDYQLMRIDRQLVESRLYEGLREVADVAECDAQRLWVGTTEGLYLLDKQSGRAEPIALPVENCRIQSLCQHTDGRLYIGTYQSGLFVYDPIGKGFVHYTADNSALLSDNICSILSDGKGGVLLGTEQGVSYLPSEGDRFYNWNRMHGLQADRFNATSGTLRRNGHFVLGSVEGAVEFGIGVFRPSTSTCRLRLCDLQILGESDPVPRLMEQLEQSGHIDLTYRQRSLSLRATAVNYNYTPAYLYTWRLADEDTVWSRPVPQGNILLRRLSPGDHRLQVRVLSSEDRREVLDEMEVVLCVARPLWMGLYLWLPLLLLGGGLLLYRHLHRRKRLATREAASGVEEPSQNPGESRFLAEVQQVVDEHLADTDYNIDTLCSQMCMSRTSFYNKMKQLTGMPPADYVRQRRLQQAARLLVTRQYSITEVADLAGFSDAKYFREVFKKHYGVSPSQYAKGVKGQGAK